jgi:uncharacterized membrane protein YbhN (UPF0104 family)
MADLGLSVSSPAVASTRSWTTIGLAGLNLAAAAAIIGWLIASGQLDLSRIWTVRNGAALGAVIACKLVATTLPLIRWHVMTRGLGLNLSLPGAIHIGLIGNFFGAAAPGMLGQDAARLAYGRSLKLGGGARLLSTVIADRVIGLATLAGLGVAGGAWYLAVKEIIPIGRLALLGALAILLVAGIGAVGARLDLPSPHSSIWRPVQRLAAALGEYRHHPKTLVIACALSVAGHMAAAAALYFGFVSLGVTPPVLPVLAVSPVLALLRGIPTTPMGLGVLDWFGEVLYSGIDLSDGAEVVMLTRLVTLGISAACGIPFLIPVRRGGADDAQ